MVFVASQLSARTVASDTTQTKVMVMDIKSDIDPRMSRYVDLALEKADLSESDVIIIHMDTYGGALKDADKIRTKLLEYEKPIWVFIDKDAASAGALISIACDSIYMARGASIGAATVVTGQGEAAPDKYQSYMRSIMRSTAEAKGRDPKIAEAMVDEKIDLDTLAPSGQVLTLSTSEAIRLGYCEGQVSSIEDILKKNQMDNYEISHFELDFVEKIISVFLNPFVSGILILIIIGGIYFELQTPGVGFPILASIIAMILYFVPYYLNGLAANWEIAVFFLGVALLALELFVIPGFGVAGFSGIALMIASLVLVMLNNDSFDFSFVEFGAIVKAVLTIVLAFLGSIIFVFFGGLKFTDTHMFKRLALQDTQKRKEGFTSSFKTISYVGKKGKAYTVLRPSGKVEIEGEILDAYTQGKFITKNSEIEVVSDEGTSLKVRKVENGEEL
nr:NfeD family protein [Xanthovirga aplysinae]